MELTTIPNSFEVLQIETGALFFVILAMAVSTWRAFHTKGGQYLPNSDVWAAGFVGTFLLMAAGFTYALGPAQFLLAVELAFGILLSVTRPANALAFFLSLQFLRPWEIDPSSSLLLALPRLTGVIALASAFVGYMRADLNRLKFGRGQWLLLAFAAWVLFTTLFTPNPGELQAEYFNSFFRAIVFFFLIVLVVRDREDISLLRHVYLWSVSGLTCVSIYLSWDQLFGIGSAATERLHSVGTLENANDIAAVLVIGIPFALRRLSDQRRQPIVWVECLGFLSVTLAALYLAQSRGALLALGAGALGWWAITTRRTRRVVITSLVIAGCIAPFANSILRRDAEDLDESSASRLTYWKAGVRMAIRSPLYGVGFSRYPKEYQTYAGDGEQFEFGERTAHSTWVLALAETGFPGFFFFIGFVFYVLRMARKVLPHEPDLFVSLVAYLIAISFLSHTYVIYPYILMGLVVASYRIHFRSNAGWAL